MNTDNIITELNNAETRAENAISLYASIKKEFKSPSENIKDIFSVLDKLIDIMRQCFEEIKTSKRDIKTESGLEVISQVLQDLLTMFNRAISHIDDALAFVKEPNAATESSYENHLSKLRRDLRCLTDTKVDLVVGTKRARSMV